MKTLNSLAFDSHYSLLKYTSCLVKDPNMINNNGLNCNSSSFSFPPGSRPTHGYTVNSRQAGFLEGGLLCKRDGLL